MFGNQYAQDPLKRNEKAENVRTILPSLNVDTIRMLHNEGKLHSLKGIV